MQHSVPARGSPAPCAAASSPQPAPDCGNSPLHPARPETIQNTHEKHGMAENFQVKSFKELIRKAVRYQRSSSAAAASSGVRQPPRHDRPSLATPVE